MGYSDDFDDERGRQGGTPPPRDSGTPSRPRSGNTPPRGSGFPSRPRSGNTPPRNLGRRVRDAFTDAYEAVSREVRSIRQRNAPDTPSRPSPTSRRPSEQWDDSRAQPAPPPTDRRYSDDEEDDSRYRSASPARASEASVEPRASHPRRSLTLRLIKRRQRLRSPVTGRKITVRATLVTIFLLLLISLTGVAAGYAYFLNAEYAQTINELAINRDFQTTRIYDRNGQLLYQTFGSTVGRRTYLTYCQIPQLVQDATVDTEDNSFWTNSGVDVQGEVRALITDIQTHGATQGGSTITQQLVKLAVLGNAQKSLTRKIPEAVLAIGITQRYTKQQILTMYLNTISYTALDYGIEAAAENLFGLQEQTVSLDPKQLNSLTAIQQNYVRHLQTSTNEIGQPCINKGQTTAVMSATWQLQPWQATLMAGFPDNPPSVHELLCDSADVVCLASFYLQNRQLGGVLAQMVKHHPQDLELGCSAGTVGCHPATPQEINDYSLQELCPSVTVKQFEQQLGCPKITTKNPKVNFFPDNAFSTASGQSTELAPFFVDYVIQQLSSELPGGFDQFASLGWNIYTTIDYGDPVSQSVLAGIKIGLNGQLTGMPAGKHIGVQQYAEFVVKNTIESNYPDYWYCTNTGFSHVVPGTIQSPNTNPFSYNQDVCLETPLDNSVNNVNDGAVVAIDPRTGDILAMVGGADYNSTDKRIGGQNNLATAPRSMGSAFKPIVYATAFQMGWYPGMIIRDEPTCFPSPLDAKTAKTQEANDKYLCSGNYMPHNDFHNTYSGAEPITYELGNSLNIPAEMALSFVGLQANNTSPLLSMAQRLGITSLSASNMGPTTALGAQDVSLLQLTGAYGTFDNNGMHVPTRAILEVTTALGGPVFDALGHPIFPYVAHPQGAQALSPEAAYMVSSVLSTNDARARDFGPSNPLNFQNRTGAGKTGTSQNTVDILTLGYTPGIAVGAWAGNADGEPMSNIIGVAGAAYIYHAVMAFAMDELNLPGTAPSRNAQPKVGGYIEPPADMHLAIVNCQNGLAPYQGMTATTQCSPSKQDSVPLFMSTEWTQNSTKLNPSAQWDCISWGCSQQSVGDPGIDYTWLINGQDPVTP